MEKKALAKQNEEIPMGRKNRRYSRRGMHPLWIVAILAVVVVGLVVGLQSFSVTNIVKQTPQNQGDAATLTYNSFTGSWGKEGTETEVYPTYTLFNEDGVKIVNDAVSNTTTDVVVGSVVDIYGTGASYYVTPVLGHVVSAEKSTANLDAYTIAATTDLVITAYDTNEDGLTADDHANNTADYNGGDVSAADNENYYLKLELNQINKAFQLYGICTYVLGDELEDFELVADGWEETESVPDKLKNQKLNLSDDTNTATSEKGFKHCYVPSDGEPILLLENEDTGKLKFVLDSDDTTQPTANGDSYFGAVFMDGSYSVDKDGNVEFSFYMDDDTEDPGTVGLDENPEAAWFGLDVGVAIEAQ